MERPWAALTSMDEFSGRRQGQKGQFAGEGASTQASRRITPTKKKKEKNSNLLKSLSG